LANGTGGQLSGATDPMMFEGYEFIPLADGYITELCGFFQGTHAINLYDSSYKLLTSLNISSYERWNCGKINPVGIKKITIIMSLLKFFPEQIFGRQPIYRKYSAMLK